MHWNDDTTINNNNHNVDTFIENNNDNENNKYDEWCIFLFASGSRTQLTITLMRRTCSYNFFLSSMHQQMCRMIQFFLFASFFSFGFLFLTFFFLTMLPWSVRILHLVIDKVYFTVGIVLVFSENSAVVYSTFQI